VKAGDRKLTLDVLATVIVEQFGPELDKIGARCIVILDVPTGRRRGLGGHAVRGFKREAHVVKTLLEIGVARSLLFLEKVGAS
jgi:hypothetical protein